jgi:hypothetical protein
MRARLVTLRGLIVAFAPVAAQACGGSGADSGSGVTGAYTSVTDEALRIEFGSGGRVTLVAAGLGSSSATFTVDGEKVIVSVDGQDHTFIRDGDCIEDQLSVFGKLCKGGQAGEAANVTTRDVPTTPTGSYVATNSDGEFRLEFKPGNRLTLTATPAGGQPDAQDGSFTIEGDVIYATLPQGVPLVLKFVNDGYESTSFGLPMRFVRQ